MGYERVIHIFNLFLKSQIFENFGDALLCKFLLRKYFAWTTLRVETFAKNFRSIDFGGFECQPRNLIPQNAEKI